VVANWAASLRPLALLLRWTAGFRPRKLRGHHVSRLLLRIPHVIPAVAAATSADAVIVNPLSGRCAEPHRTVTNSAGRHIKQGHYSPLPTQAAWHTTKAEISRLEDRCFQAMIDSDFYTLDKLLGDDLIYTHSTSPAWTAEPP
jgi:hypothetical protein